MPTTAMRALGTGLLLPVMLLVGLTGCGDSPTTPGIQPEITNTPDRFEYQISSIENYTGTSEFAWQNSGAAANVDLSSAVSSGAGTVVILDDGGQVVFSSSLSASGSQTTSTGTPGSWTVRVAYETFTGTVNFRVEKSTP